MANGPFLHHLVALVLFCLDLSVTEKLQILFSICDVKLKIHILYFIYMKMLLDCEGIIEEAIMLGAPVTGNTDDWQPLARVVSGRIVNGYSRLS